MSPEGQRFNCYSESMSSLNFRNQERFNIYSETLSSLNFGNQAAPVFPVPDAFTSLLPNENIFNGSIPDYGLVSGQFNSGSEGRLLDCGSPEDCDFSDAVLKYINHILMEEDVEDKTCMFQESAALQAQEKSFYEAIGQHYPGENFFGESRSYWPPGDSDSLCQELFTDPSSSSLISQSFSYCSSISNGTVLDSPMSTLRNIDIFGDNNSPVLFKWEVEDQSNFFPRYSNLFVDNAYDESVHKSSAKIVAELEKEIGKKVGSLDLSRGKKNPYHDSLGVEDGPSRKQAAIYYESSVSPDMFDKVLLCSKGKNESAIRDELNAVTTKTASQNGHSKGSNGVKSYGKNPGRKRNVVDLRTLLTLCAQAVAADDHKTANEYLMQIRQHVTPTGDGMQRLAYYFANGLEARMAGSGTEIYNALINKPTSAADILKAYHIYLATCPFRKLSNFFSNKTIMKLSENVSKLHIVDFGIQYGFQWPSFLQRLSSRAGGPPKFRITGIDFPCPGFRPAQRVEETGRRLARYAETFKVPFEFNAIAQKWETIRVEDIKIDKDELLVVNSVSRLRNLVDESVMVNCPRNQVLSLIRKMNPSVFIMGVLNGAYNAPFFITRFREALFHYSSFFDMLEANIPREVHERMLLEQTIFGQEAMNVIACEGSERIERPETYKQWQVRNMRAGFETVPLDKDVIEMAKRRVKLTYNKDFVVDEDGNWMLQGWKGRIVYAISSWKPQQQQQHPSKAKQG